MKIELDTITYSNFKGLKEFYLIADGKNVTVYGDNRTGKTTLADGWSFLLFGKNSQGQDSFSIKTIDKATHECIHNLEYRVRAMIRVDDEKHTLGRIYKEVWKTEKGEEKLKLKGHTTEYFFDAPIEREMDYKSRIASLIDEETFKLITNPMFFNSLPWEKRRAVLIKIAGDIRNEDVAELKPEFKELLGIIGTKRFEDYKAELNSLKTAIVKKQKDIPVRIDEVSKQIPIEPNYDEVLKEIEETVAIVNEYDSQLLDRSQASVAKIELIDKKQKEIVALRLKLTDIELATQNSNKSIQSQNSSNLEAAKIKLETAIKEYNRLTSVIESHRTRVEELKKQVDTIRDKWKALNNTKLEIKPEDCECPTCKRPFEGEDLQVKQESLIANFNKDKIAKLASIKTEGLIANEDIGKYNKQIADNSVTINDLYRDIDNLKQATTELSSGTVTATPVDFKTLPEYISIQSDIKELEAELTGLSTKQDNEELKAKKAEAETKLNSLRGKAKIKEDVEKLKNRIKELNEDGRTLAQELANLQKREFMVEEFEKVKIAALEEKVNRIFTHVKFRMFKPLLNGGNEPYCETLVDGIPWSDANTEGKFNAGIDIINVISDFYNVYAPIWLDNAESVTSFIPTKSQLIKLVVSEPDKKLRVEK